MTKSKAKSSTFRSTQGDFRLQTKRHTFVLHTPRVPSRSCSPVHQRPISPSLTSSPPRTKVTFADFTSATRVSSKRKNKTMQKIGSPAPSLHFRSSGGRNGGSSGSSRASPLATECHTKRRVGVHPSGSYSSLGGLTPTLTIVPPPLSSSIKSHPSAPRFDVTPLLMPLLHHRWWISLNLVVAEVLRQTHH
jgi:hypothetical protein